MWNWYSCYRVKLLWTGCALVIRMCTCESKRCVHCKRGTHCKRAAHMWTGMCTCERDLDPVNGTSHLWTGPRTCTGDISDLWMWHPTGDRDLDLWTGLWPSCANGTPTPIFGQCGYMHTHTPSYPTPPPCESPQFWPWQLLKTPHFRSVQLEKIILLKKIYVSSLFLSPKPLFHVWASTKSPQFSVWGRSLSPLLLTPPPPVAHLYHFHIWVPPTPTRRPGTMICERVLDVWTPPPAVNRSSAYEQVLRVNGISKFERVLHVWTGHPRVNQTCTWSRTNVSSKWAGGQGGGGGGTGVKGTVGGERWGGAGGGGGGARVEGGGERG